jgi:hypothetical protein
MFQFLRTTETSPIVRHIGGEKQNKIYGSVYSEKKSDSAILK